MTLPRNVEERIVVDECVSRAVDHGVGKSKLRAKSKAEDMECRGGLERNGDGRGDAIWALLLHIAPKRGFGRDGTWYRESRYLNDGGVDSFSSPSWGQTDFPPSS